jgi:hypothetical protein
MHGACKRRNTRTTHLLGVVAGDRHIGLRAQVAARGALALVAARAGRPVVRVAAPARNDPLIGGGGGASASLACQGVRSARNEVVDADSPLRRLVWLCSGTHQPLRLLRLARPHSLVAHHEEFVSVARLRALVLCVCGRERVEAASSFRSLWPLRALLSLSLATYLVGRIPSLVARHVCVRVRVWPRALAPLGLGHHALEGGG